ncbi:YkyA family protein [Carnobacterium viridans]|uniref:Flagellin N-terminal helical region n=1 Tax=Carnobacterium viridans TaxID=174587 RepID=A0A1H0Y354_9LACT|nr:YkyA family protein [Carnobacterium viridans]UDE95377.1 YkyA family protein [Carnobacterium viridans]SDQ09491.1 flagellin N-terminal helical region [Carnobacterium viridans]
MKKRYLVTNLFAVSLFLTACGNDDVAKALETTTSVETQNEQIVNDLNAISEQEKGLQSTFETTLSEDDTLSTLADKSSAVFENIETRSTSLSELKETISTMKEKQVLLEEETSDKLPQEELTALSTNIEELTANLEKYIAHYKTVLDEQETYFSDLGKEDATYETLTAGIETINNSDTETKALLTKLDQQLVAVQDAQAKSTASLNELNESSK